MDEYSDNTNFIFLCLGFLTMYAIVKTTNIILMSNYKWDIVQCNPFYMLMGSFMDFFMGTKKSQKTFEKCIKTMAKNEFYDRQEKNIKQNKEKTDKGIEVLTKSVGNEIDKMQKSQKEVVDLLTETSRNVETTIDKQNKINEVIIKSNVPISTLSTKINQLSNNFKNTMQSFMNSKLVDGID